MQDLPENHFRVGGASWVNINNYYLLLYQVIIDSCFCLVRPHQHGWYRHDLPSKAFETLYKRQLYTTNVAAGVGDSRSVPLTASA